MDIRLIAPPQFIKGIRDNYSLYQMAGKVHYPLDLGYYDSNTLSALEMRIRDVKLQHFMIKSNDNKHFRFGDIERKHPYLTRFAEVVRKLAGEEFVANRYAYLSVDTRFVDKGETQRDPGFHVDDLQGAEVPHKKPGGLTFMWCDTLPTEYAYQSFNIIHLDLARHQIFSHLDKMADPETVARVNPKHIIAINPYCVHRSMVAPRATCRVFVRLCFTHVPVTNTRMDINHCADYNYDIHSTSGTIPGHLKLAGEDGS